MPLPRSLTCASCQHTYPEGWKRCPYCGFDPEKQKRDRQIERALTKRFPSYAAAVGSTAGGQKRKQQSRRDRSQDRPPRQGNQPRVAADGDAAEAERKRSRRRRGRRRRGGTGATDAPQENQSPQPQSTQQRPHRERRPATGDKPTAPAAPPREARPPGDSEGSADAQARRNRRRRSRRRRKPGGGGNSDAGEQKSDS